MTTDAGWFGFRFGFLPDFLLDHTLLGAEAEARLPEHCRRWTQFIGSLWREQDTVTYLLRYDWNPLNTGQPTSSSAGQMDVLLLGRLNDSSIVEAFVRDVEALLNTFGLEPERLGSHQVLTECDALLLRFPSQSAACFEIRQQDEMLTYRAEESAFDIPEAFRNLAAEQTSVSIPRSRASLRETPSTPEFQRMYALRPWWGPGGNHLLTVRALSAQMTAVSLCVLLQPTTLEEEERRLLAAVAREGESMAQQTTTAKNGIGNIQVQASQNRTDPQLRFASRLYAAHLRRLSHPFLCAAYCFSAQKGVALQVARALASVIREETPLENTLGEAEPLPSGAMVVPLSSELGLAMCSQLKFDYATELATRIPELTSACLARQPYLVDARGAMTVFRLPVNMRGGVQGIAVKQRPPDFHPGPLRRIKPDDHIELGTFHAGGISSLPVEAFKKHALITGFTGSGKTTTMLNLLHQFWLEHSIPFLVIESAKKEYRGLLANERFRQDAPSLLVYTLGNETCAPFRLNPFELLPGMRVEAHTSRLQACFEAALPPLPFLPSILAEALEQVYKRFWWTLTDVYDPSTQAGRRFPRMIDFYETVGQVAAARGYAGEMRGNVIAATSGRIKQLLIGSLGLMFGDEHSISPALLFERPVILELNDLNLNDKAMVMMFLLTLLREYRELHPSNHLAHLTVVEEAHNVLGQVESQGTGEGAGSDTRAKSVEAFCNMLAEVRALGEGLIIADQSPNKLAPDALRNTNVQIAHQLRDAHDRESIANALIMDEEQRDFLGKIEPGKAALFYTGLEKATFISATNYHDRPDAAFDEHVSDAIVKAHMAPHTERYRQTLLPFKGCDFCLSQCQYRETALALIQEKALDAEVQDAFKVADTERYGERSISHSFKRLVDLSRQATFQMTNEAAAADSAWCLFLHWSDRHRAGDADGMNSTIRNYFDRRYQTLCREE